MNAQMDGAAWKDTPMATRPWPKQYTEPSAHEPGCQERGCRCLPVASVKVSFHPEPVSSPAAVLLSFQVPA